MGRHFFGLDLVVKLHGVGKAFLYLNVSVFMVGVGLLLLQSDSCWIIRILFARQSSSPVVVRPPGFRLLACVGFRFILWG